MLAGRGRGCCVEQKAGKPNRPWEEANRLRKGEKPNTNPLQRKSFSIRGNRLSLI